MNLWCRGQTTAKYHGLVNQGATCYLNSVLQVLFMTEDFKERVKSHNWKNAETEPIDRELRDLFNDLEKNNAQTHKITNKLKIKNVYEQRDAAEHYEKILRLTSPEASEIFHGALVNRSTCQRCNTQTESEAGFWHLPLPLVDSNNDYSVEKGIEDFFRPAVISGEDQMYCEQCDEKCDAVLDCEVKHHPEVLVLLLKRFEFDYRYMTYVKIHRAVNVPNTLHIPQNQVYELYAFIDHFGELRYGHYISTVKPQDDDKWYSFNDSKISQNDLPKTERSNSAYLLFYRKHKDPVDRPEDNHIVPEETPATSGEEENDLSDKSVRAAPKRSMSLDESENTKEAQIKRQKQNQAVKTQQAAGQEYEDNTKNDTEAVFDKNRQDLDYSDSEVKMQDDSKQENANSDCNQSSQPPHKVDDRIVDTQCNEFNTTSVTTKQPNEDVKNVQESQEMSPQSSGQEYSFKKLENGSDTKEYVSGDRGWNNEHSSGLSGKPVDSIDMKDVPGGEHGNIEEKNQAGVRESFEKTPLSSYQDGVDKQVKSSCSGQHQSDIGAHAVNSETSHRQDYDPVETSDCEGDVGGDTSQISYSENNFDNNENFPELCGVAMQGNESKECLTTNEMEKKAVAGGEHVTIEEANQTEVRGCLEKTTQGCKYDDENVEDCRQHYQSGIGTYVSDETGQTKQLCAERYDNCDPALPSLPTNASGQSSMTKDTDVTSEHDTIQYNQKQDDWSDTGVPKLGELSCSEILSEMHTNDDVGGDTCHRSEAEDNSDNFDPSFGLSGVHMTRDDLKTMEIEKENVCDDVKIGAEDQAQVREGMAGLQNTAQQSKPGSDTCEGQQGIVNETQRPQDQSDDGDLAETRSKMVKNGYELMKNGTEGVSAQDGGEKSDEMTKTNINSNHEDNKKHVSIETDKTNTPKKCLLTKYDLCVHSVRRYKEIYQENELKHAQVCNKSQSEAQDKDKEPQHNATKTTEYHHCTSENTLEERSEQKESGSGSWSDKESEAKERVDQSQKHETKYSKHVIQEGATEKICIILNKKGSTQPNARHELNEKITVRSISCHDNRGQAEESLSEGVASLTLDHGPCEGMRDRTTE